jgi:hypothetical protein
VEDTPSLICACSARKSVPTFAEYALLPDEGSVLNMTVQQDGGKKLSHRESASRYGDTAVFRHPHKNPVRKN